MNRRNDRRSLLRAAVSVVIALGAAYPFGTRPAVADPPTQVWAWGYNRSGQIGVTDVFENPDPLRMSGITGVIAVAGGDDHTLALRSDGTVWAWGEGILGELGHGDLHVSPVPVQVLGPGGVGFLTDVTAITVARTANGAVRHNLALRSDGTVWAWGTNDAGERTFTPRAVPVQVSGLAGVTAVAAGYEHSLALKSDGTVWAWGWNAYGQLGDGTFTDRATPVRAGSKRSVRSRREPTTVWR